MRSANTKRAAKIVNRKVLRILIKVHPAIIFFAIVSIWSSQAIAQNVDHFVGVYDYIGSSQESIIVETIVTRVVEKINPFLRFFAKRKLAEICKIPNRIIITGEVGELAIKLVPWPVRISSINGIFTEFLNTEGNQASIARKLEGKVLVEIIKVRSSERIILYRLSKQGSFLNLHWKVTSPVLPEDIQYNLSYHRKKGDPVLIRN